MWWIASYLVALSLEQEQGEVTGSDVWLGSEAAVLSELVMFYVWFYLCMLSVVYVVDAHYFTYPVVLKSITVASLSPSLYQEILPAATALLMNFEIF